MNLRLLKFARIYRFAGVFGLEPPKFNFSDTPQEEKLEEELEEGPIQPSSLSFPTGPSEEEEEEFVEVPSDEFPAGTLIMIECVGNKMYPGTSLGHDLHNGHPIVRFKYNNGQEDIAPLSQISLRENSVEDVKKHLKPKTKKPDPAVDKIKAQLAKASKKLSDASEKTATLAKDKTYLKEVWLILNKLKSMKITGADLKKEVDKSLSINKLHPYYEKDKYGISVSDAYNAINYESKLLEKLEGLDENYEESIDRGYEEVPKETKPKAKPKGKSKGKGNPSSGEALKLEKRLKDLNDELSEIPEDIKTLAKNEDYLKVIKDIFTALRKLGLSSSQFSEEVDKALKSKKIPDYYQKYEGGFSVADAVRKIKEIKIIEFKIKEVNASVPPEQRRAFVNAPDNKKEIISEVKAKKAVDANERSEIDKYLASLK